MAGSSRGCGNPEDKLRNDEDISKSAALRELEKARVRECQMEKTVRWWTVCTAGWRKKWSKLRHENEELRKQIKSYKTQINGITQDCVALHSKLEDVDTHNVYLKSEMNKLLMKYGDEPEERVQEILNAPDIVKPKAYTCIECQMNKNEGKNSEENLTTPELENPMFPEGDFKFPMNDDANNDTKNVEVLTEMISKIFSELQTLKGEFVKHSEGTDMKELTDFPVSAEQISQLKLFMVTKQLEKEQLAKKELLNKLDAANREISTLHDKMDEIVVRNMFNDPKIKLTMENLGLSDDE